MRPLCPQCSRRYGSVPYADNCLVVPPCGHAMCYKCARKKRSRACSSGCKEKVKTTSLAFPIFDCIDLDDKDWVEKLVSARSASRSLDKIALKETHDLLEEERSGVNLSLQDFCLGSTLQAAVGTFVLETSGAEEEEDRISKDMAVEIRQLEKLELEIQAIKSHLAWQKEVDGECDIL